MSEDIQNDELNNDAVLNKLSKKQLISFINTLKEEKQVLKVDLENILKEKNSVKTNFEELLRKVAKWETDKNILTNILKKEYESKEIDLVKDILEVLDMLDEFKNLNLDKDTLISIDLYAKKLIERFKLKEIQLDSFDPSLHVAVGKTEKGEKISKCIKKGYLYMDKLIRYANVILD
jgi:molecular chaperone GrpE (heat shock protein)